MAREQRYLLSVLGIGLSFLGACGPVLQGKSPAGPAPPASSASSTPIVVATTYVSPTDASTVQEMFEQAKTALMVGQFAQAAAGFDKVASLEPAGPYAAAALFNAGLACDQLDDRNGALKRFRDLIGRFPGSLETSHALIRTMRILAYLERWTDLVSNADLLLARADATPTQRLEALGSRSLGLVEHNDIDGAATANSKARAIIEEMHLDDAGGLPIATGPVFFALGEIRRIKAQRIGFVPAPANFTEVLEERCQMLLDAQTAYATTMRTYDAHWAAMAGYRVGQLYAQLHSDLIAIPPPAAAKTDRQKQLFEGAMRLRYRVLLEKGLQMMDRTLRMAERTSEKSVWVSRASDAVTDLERAIAQEKEALRRLPYSEAELQRALDDLALKKAGQKP